MLSAITTLTFVVMTLGASNILTASHDGVPGRRIGGGTRYEAPSLPRLIDV